MVATCTCRWGRRRPPGHVVCCSAWRGLRGPSSGGHRGHDQGHDIGEGRHSVWGAKFEDLNLPEVIGRLAREEEDATQALEEAGFEVEEETGESSESYEGYVTEQDPRGGRNAEVGSTVTITVGRGPPMQPAPTPTTDVPDPDVPTPDVPASDVRPSTPAQPIPSIGAATPTGGSCSPDSPIKGNHSSSGELIYHVPGGRSYNATNPEECFANEEEAQSAGYRASRR